MDIFNVIGNINSRGKGLPKYNPTGKNAVARIYSSCMVLLMGY